MKVLGVLFIIVLTIISCQQKSVELPTLGVKGIQDTIYNNSKIWIFYKLEGNDTIAELNKNNSVANTHWVFNIDKRLSLKKVIPNVQVLQAKKEKPSMHDNGELMHNYYSYVDTLSNKLSLILFDSIQYVTEKSINRDSILKQDQFKHLFIDSKKDKVFINDQLIEKDKIEDIISRQLDSGYIKINLSFDKGIPFQHYIFIKALLQNIKSDSMIISNKEYIN